MRGRDVLIYLLAELYRTYGKPIAVRKKIQKLLFLVEHLRGGRLSRSSGVTGYRFVIWSYGSLSKGIYDDLDYLVNSNYIDEEVRAVAFIMVFGFVRGGLGLQTLQSTSAS